MEQVKPVRWDNGKLIIIDQTVLPTEFKEIELANVQDVWDAVRALKVRGAPAIGVCAAFGVLVGVRERAPQSAAGMVEAVGPVADYLATSRPTAVNLFWALDRMRAAAQESDASSPDRVWQHLEAAAIEVMEDDTLRCRAIGDHGAILIDAGDGVLTHCNAGALATSSYGTALAVMFRAHEQGKAFHVFADETRPLLQGARLTAWELQRAGIDTTLICDNTAAQVMKEGRVQKVVVGSDRVAANGDAANKIGTYSVAVLAKAHNIPFFVAAPLSTFDLSLPSGDEIPIELRASEEVTHSFGRQTAPDGINVYSPAFDVTPASLITAFITEHGVLYPPFPESIAAAAGRVQSRLASTAKR